MQSLRSTNLTYYLTVWEVAKNCTGLISFQKRIYPKYPNDDEKTDDNHVKHGTTVDLITMDGLEWVKVSNITEYRLIHELAEKGHACDSDEEEGWPDEDDMVDILKIAHDLHRVSQGVRVRYKVIMLGKMTSYFICAHAINPAVTDFQGCTKGLVIYLFRY